MESLQFHASAHPMNFHVESINDVVNLVSLRFLSLGQHFCSSWCGDDMPVRRDVAGQKISDPFAEMVLHQSDSHVPLDLSFETSLVSENLQFCFCVLCVGSGKPIVW